MDAFDEAKAEEVDSGQGRFLPQPARACAPPPLRTGPRCTWCASTRRPSTSTARRRPGTSPATTSPRWWTELKTMHAKGRGVIGMKIIGNGDFTKPEDREKSIRFAMSRPETGRRGHRLQEHRRDRRGHRAHEPGAGRAGLAPPRPLVFRRPRPAVWYRPAVFVSQSSTRSSRRPARKPANRQMTPQRREVQRRATGRAVEVLIVHQSPHAALIEHQVDAGFPLRPCPNHGPGIARRRSTTCGW